MTPIEIIDQMMKDMPDFPEEWEDWYFYLWKARERIINECTVRLSDGDNTYDIPYALEKDFWLDVDSRPQDESEDDFYNWCDNFDRLYSQYKV